MMSGHERPGEVWRIECLGPGSTHWIHFHDDTTREGAEAYADHFMKDLTPGAVLRLVHYVGTVVETREKMLAKEGGER